ncbi:S1 family peptidase [Nocardia sp. NPDC020380]|uniref:S1 family peptidase n=1 Tax=Nocardia sp. NPDC020380 TaxID=3364309 RepID=UPI0037BA8311
MAFPKAARHTAYGCCLLLAAGSGVAAADPAPHQGDLPATLAAAISRDLGLDATHYLARAEQAKHLADFETVARVGYHDSFAGVRMDGDRAIVALAKGSSRADAGKAAERAGFTVEDVTYSEAALHQRRDAVLRWISGQPANITGTVYGDGIDVAHNDVVLHTTGAPQLPPVPPELGPVRVLSAGEPSVGPSPESTGVQPLVISAPGGEYMGGRAFAFDFHGGTARCSVAFNATDAKGNTLFLTAGHCDPANLDPSVKGSGPQPVYDYSDGSKGEELGVIETSSFGPHDFSIVHVRDEQAARFRNNLVSTETRDAPGKPAADTPDKLAADAPGNSGSVGSNDQTALPSGSGGEPGTPEAATPSTPLSAASEPLRIDGTASPVVGAPACKSGAISGFTCGTVLEVGRSYSQGGLPGRTDKVTMQGFFRVNTCGLHGDSGGSVMTGTKALGIVSASTSADACSPTGSITAQPIDAVIAAVPGLQIRSN